MFDNDGSFKFNIYLFISVIDKLKLLISFTNNCLNQAFQLRTKFDIYRADNFVLKGFNGVKLN